MSSYAAGETSPGLSAGDAVLAFDVGGTDMKAALVDDMGRIRDILRVPTPIDGEWTADAVVTRLGDLARQLRGDHRAA